MPPSQWKGVALDQLLLALVPFLSARRSEFPRSGMRNFPHEKLPKTRLTVDLSPDFLIQIRHNRCSDQNVMGGQRGRSGRRFKGTAWLGYGG